MKSISTALQNLLATNNFKMADLFTFTLTNGAVLRFTSYDWDLVWNGNPYSHSGLLIDRTKCSWKNDLSVDTLTLTITPAANYTLYGSTFQNNLREGIFDGAIVELDRAFMAVAGPLSVVGIVIMFVGRVGETDANRLTVEMTINSFNELLDIQIPQNLYQTSCIWPLYGVGCGILQSAFSTAGIVYGIAPSLNKIPVNINFSAGYYNGGILTFTSGVLSGVSVTIQSYDGYFVYLSVPLPAAPAPADKLLLAAGCDRTLNTCANVFNNLAHFRGYPCIPVVETAYE